MSFKHPLKVRDDLKGNARLPWKGFATQHQMTPQNNSLLPPRNYFEFTQRQALLTPSHVPATLQPNKMRSGVKPQLTMVSLLMSSWCPTAVVLAWGSLWARWILPKGHVINLHLMEVNILLDVLGHFATHQAHVYHVVTKSYLGINYFLTLIWFVVSPKSSSQEES
jgi:hypothetical protein